MTYKIEWKEKAHRNMFQKNQKEIISINIRHGILISETPVTQKLWKTLMGTNPSSFIGDDRPVETVGFNEIFCFIERLKLTTNNIFKLPSKWGWTWEQWPIARWSAVAGQDNKAEP